MKFFCYSDYYSNKLHTFDLFGKHNNYRGGGYKVLHKTPRRPYNHPLSGKFENRWTL